MINIDHEAMNQAAEICSKNIRKDENGNSMRAYGCDTVDIKHVEAAAEATRFSRPDAGRTFAAALRRAALVLSVA